MVMYKEMKGRWLAQNLPGKTAENNRNFN